MVNRTRPLMNAWPWPLDCLVLVVATRVSSETSTVRALYWDEDLQTGQLSWAAAASIFLDEPLDPTGDRASWEQRVHPEDVELVRSARQMMREGLSQWNGEYRIRAGTGWRRVLEQMVLIEASGAAVRIIGTIRDATPAPVLLDSERRFATFVDQLPLLVWEADADGWIDFYNQRWFEYTGTTFDQMQGWGWARVHAPEDLPRMLRVWRNALGNGLPWEDVFRLRGADGVFRWHMSRAFPLRNSAGQIVRWFGSNTDVHEQRLALEEREQLLQIEKRLRAESEAVAREKDEFLAVVSHELRTPLGSVLTRAQILRPEATTPRLAVGLEKIEHNAQRLARLIEDLLDTSRIMSGKLDLGREVIDVVAAVRNAVESVTPDANQRRITIDLDVAGGLEARVLGTASRLEQIAANLIGNAVKFSFDQGRISVRVATRNDEAVLEVQDEGEGMEPGLIPQLFQRFKQGDSSARRRHGGLGLGLSIVRHLVVAHDGRVEAASDGPGKGSVFRAVFPLARSGTSPLAAPHVPQPESVVSLAGIRVLGVDDDAEARDVLALALIACGATITLAGSVAEALDRLRIEVPDIILSDLAMPEVDGFGLLGSVRESADPRIRALPMVAVTAHASAHDRAAAIRTGFDAYIAKPFHHAVMSRVIADLVRAKLTSSS